MDERLQGMLLVEVSRIRAELVALATALHVWFPVGHEILDRVIEARARLLTAERLIRVGNTRGKEKAP